MIVRLLTEHHLEFLSLKGGCRGSSESTLVKMSNCWKSHAAAQIYYYYYYYYYYHCDLPKNETIVIVISSKRYFSHPE